MSASQELAGLDQKCVAQIDLLVFRTCLPARCVLSSRFADSGLWITTVCGKKLLYRVISLNLTSRYAHARPSSSRSVIPVAPAASRPDRTGRERLRRRNFPELTRRRAATGIIVRNRNDLYEPRLKPRRPSRRPVQQREGQDSGDSLARLLLPSRLNEVGFPGATVQPPAIVEPGVQRAESKQGHRNFRSSP